MPMLPPAFLPFWMEEGRDSVPPSQGQGQALGIILSICGIAAFYASLYAPSESGQWGWYPRLAKPSWALPPSFTGPVSTLFYLVLAISIWRIWRTGAFRTIPFTLAGFAFLLLLQSIWSTLFYGLKSPFLGMADLALIAVLATLLWFTYKTLDAWAAALWLAYLMWVVILFLVNTGIWWLNG
ncbi:MAG: tryptophan-rich sensory protein [Acidobacteria bacterium]|nr:tryptophan-rich sensory protein [Acidobacteriota bacterium]